MPPPFPLAEDYALGALLLAMLGAVVWLLADWFEAGCPRNPEGD